MHIGLRHERARPRVAVYAAVFESDERLTTGTEDECADDSTATDSTATDSTDRDTVRDTFGRR
mgnify:CR=1 FL=1